jgi:prepilin-type N-terminal cleavage/methylation domain-containing protein
VPRRRSEGGFSLIELIVVVFIVLALIAIAMFAFRGSKRAAHFKTASAAAAQYSNAIEAYMADNGQTPPAVGSASWPSATAGPVDVMVGGPGGKPYMASIPEAVSDGLVSFGSPSADAKASITYTVTGRTYQLVVNLVPAGDPTQRCAITNGPSLPSGMTRCS